MFLACFAHSLNRGHTPCLEAQLLESQQWVCEEGGLGAITSDSRSGSFVGPMLSSKTTMHEVVPQYAPEDEPTQSFAGDPNPFPSLVKYLPYYSTQCL